MKKISVGILAVGLVAIMASLWHRANKSAMERDRALDVTRFLLHQFQLEAPHAGEGGEIKAREVLDLAVRRAEEAIGLPEDRAAALGALGGAYLGLGLYADAERLLQWSLSLRRTQASAPGSELVIVLLDLAIARRFMDGGADARSLAVEATELVLDRQVGDLRLADHLSRRAASLNHRSACPSMAELLYRLSLEVRLRLLGSCHADIADTRHNLALALELQGRYDEAMDQLEQALELRTSLHGEESLEVARTLNAIAALLQHTPETDQAIAAARRSLDLRVRYGHPGVAKARNTLGTMFRLQGDFAEAETVLRQAYQSSAGSFSTGREAGAALSELANVLLSQDRPAEAVPLARRALNVLRRNLPAEHWQVAEAESVLGDGLLKLGRLSEAQPLVVRGYVNLRADRGAGSRHAREAAQRLDHLARDLGKSAEETRAWKLELDERARTHDVVCR